MMRILFLSFLAAAAGSPDQLTCAINGAKALDDAVDAGMYLWASTERCAKGNKYDGLKCEIDVTAALESVIKMVSIITEAVSSCAGDIDSINAQCGQAAGALASATAGLTSGAGSLTHWIQKKSGGGDAVVDKTTTNVGKCVVDVKHIATNIFEAAAGIKAAKAGCNGDDEKCAAHALGVISVVANLGSAVSHSVAHCSASGNTTADMSGDMIDFVNDLDNVARAGIAIDEKCSVSDERLFSIENSNVASSNMPAVNNLVIAAMVPLAAVAGFVGGRRQKSFNKAQTRDIEETLELVSQ